MHHFAQILGPLAWEVRVLYTEDIPIAGDRSEKDFLLLKKSQKDKECWREQAFSILYRNSRKVFFNGIRADI